MLFHTKLLVTKFGIKKNSKTIRRNRHSGRIFIATNDRAKALEDQLILKLKSLFLRTGKDSIALPINCKYVFYFPKSVYYTKKGLQSKTLPDLSNLFETVSDALQKSGIIENDRHISGFDGSRRAISPDNNYYLEISITALV